jgi:peptidyl-prolyl cis-trans isomerase D
MRKHAGSWMIKVLLFAIVVVFSFWGVGNFRSREDTYLAKVNGEIISFDLYRRTYNNMLEQYRRAYGGQINDEMIKMLNLRMQTVNQLVDRTLLLQEADRLKINVTDEEVTDTIKKYPAFQVNGVFDKTRYLALLNQIRMSVEDFESDQKEGLRVQKLQDIVQDSVMVSDDEAREWYRWFNTEVDMSYVLFEPGRYKDISPEDDKIEAYFDAHQDEYKTDPSVKVSYLLFEPASYREKIQIGDDQITQYYENHIDEFKKEKTVQARHILLKLDEKADEKTVEARKEKALEIYKMAADGKDFAELANKYSEGPTRDKGGDLGTFKKETMVKPFAEKAFSMKAGEISEPVRTRFGWHIIKVEKINEGGTESLEQARDGIRKNLVDEQARTKALAHAEEVYDNVFDGDKLADAGQTYGVLLKTTDYFVRAKPPLKKVRNQRKFVETAFGLEKMGISEILELSDGYYILQVEDRKDASVPLFETVADRVKKDLIKSLQKDRAKEDAETMLAAIQKGEKLEEAVKQYDLKVKATGFFKRSGSIPNIGYAPRMIEEAFLLSDEKPLCETPVEDSKGWFVLQLKERKKPAEEGFEKEQDTIVTQLTQQKKQSVYQQWLADVKSRSEIHVNDKLIE